MNRELEDRLSLAINVAKQAGNLAMNYFDQRDGLLIERKRHITDLVSEADRNVEKLIRHSLKNAFPEDGQLGEEHGVEEGTSGYTWIIDPIDGTAPFLSGLPGWCVSIGLHNGKRSILGVIYAPVMDELFEGAKGLGARVNGRKIHVIDGDLRAAMVGFGMNDRIPLQSGLDLMERLTNAGTNWARYGSGALMLAYLAAGRLSGYTEPSMSIWDCAAAYALIEEAGGIIRNFPTGDKILAGAPVLAAAPNAYQELVELSDYDSDRYVFKG